jgi:hypothetical protein
MKLAAVVAVVLALSGCDGPFNTQQGYRPAQPIEFSHALHAGSYGISCQYCHTGAERSRHAGIPAVSICMNCHSQVRTDAPAIAALGRFADPKNTEPLAWTRVHRLPDHAFFDHASHVGAGVVCQTCHGPVETMVRIEQVETMKMGWCLDCHRETLSGTKDAPLPIATLSLDRMGSLDAIPVRSLSPPTHCSACHR